MIKGTGKRSRFHEDIRRRGDLQGKRKTVGKRGGTVPNKSRRKEEKAVARCLGGKGLLGHKKENQNGASW